MIPRLTTARLVLDAFTLDDVPTLVELAGNPEVYATTLNIPHPYTADDARAWIAGHLTNFLKGESVSFAIRREGRLVGGIGMIVRRRHDCATIGYWLGRPYWGQGYATEAVRALLAYGFQQQSLEKIEADHLAGNHASGHVMEKAGMKHEGVRPHHFKKDEKYLDAVIYGLTRTDAIAAGLISADGPATPLPQPTPTRIRNPDDPPFAEELSLANASSLERAQLQRHFLGKNVAELEQELRVYGKSLAPDFALLSPVALAYYLKSAQAYFESEHSEGDWDFAYGLVSALAPRLRDGELPSETREFAQTLVRHVHDQAARYFIEKDKQPFVGWVAEALKE